MPPVGKLETTLAGGGSAGECSLLVAEQLALDNRFGKGAAVGFDEGVFAAIAVLMDGFRQLPLAGSSLSQQKHGGFRRGDLLDLAVYPLPSRRAAHHPPESVAPVETAMEVVNLVDQALVRETPPQNSVDLGEYEGADLEIIGSLPHSFCSELNPLECRAGDRYRTDLGVALQGNLNKPQAIHPLRLEIADQSIDPLPVEDIVGRLTLASPKHLVPFLVQKSHQMPGFIGFRQDDEDTRRRRRRVRMGDGLIDSHFKKKGCLSFFPACSFSPFRCLDPCACV